MKTIILSIFLLATTFIFAQKIEHHKNFFTGHKYEVNGEKLNFDEVKSIVLKNKSEDFKQKFKSRETWTKIGTYAVYLGAAQLAWNTGKVIFDKDVNTFEAVSLVTLLGLGIPIKAIAVNKYNKSISEHNKMQESLAYRLEFKTSGLGAGVKLTF